MATHLPMDHPLNRVYRTGGAIVGVVLIAYGVLAFLANLAAIASFTGTDVLGLRTNGVLGIILVVLGLAALLAGLVGRNLASTINMSVGTLLMIIGVIGLCIIRTPVNVIATGVPMVCALFVVGMLSTTCGLYGRVSGGKLESTATASERPFREEFGKS